MSYAGIAKGVRDTRITATKAATATKTKAGATKTSPATKTAAPAAPRLSVAAQDSLFKIEQKYTEAAVSTNERREKLGVKVALSDFSVSDAKATVAGSVTNQGTAPKSVTLKVDFLDSTGKVVASKEHAVADIAAGRSARFSITHTPGKEVAAFRYTRID